MGNISTAKQLIKLCRQADVALHLWSVHGLGKSSLVRQVADEQGIEFVDFRCAQIEASDLRGLPDKGSDGRTHFLPPADLPTSGSGILFLDELNRANNEVLAAAFQLVLDRRVGQYRLPAGWSIVCAGNLDNGDYAVTDLDPAFRDRFCHVLLSAGKSTFNEWADWMSQNYPETALDLVTFCGANLKHLEVVDNERLGFRVTPSRRSWEMVARILRAWQQRGFSKRTRTEAMAGLVGRELAIAFSKHRSPVTPRDVLRTGVAKLAEKISQLERNQKMALMFGLASYAKDSIDDEEIAEVVLDFAELLFAHEKDLAIGFCTTLISEVGVDRERLPHAQEVALLQNTRLVAAVARVNREQQNRPLFIDHLAARPQLAKAVAEAMSTAPVANEEVSP